MLNIYPFKIYTLQKFKTRFCKRGRTVRQKSLVIQRVLPIVSSPHMSSACLTTDDPSKIDESSLCQTETHKMVAVNASETQDKNFLDALETSGDVKNSNSIITSATQILKEGEHQWLNSEVCEFIRVEITLYKRGIVFSFFSEMKS